MVSYGEFEANVLNLREVCVASQLPVDGRQQIVDVDYVFDVSSLCLATAAGQLLFWNCVSGETDLAGILPEGISAMRWSPDCELVALVSAGTSDDGYNVKFCLLTREFEPVVETAANPTSFGRAQLADVGWGSRETQFHGTKGRKAALAEKPPVRSPTKWDRLRPILEWRSDGAYLACSTIDPATSCRRVRIWTREGELHCTCEDPSDGTFLPSLYWCTSGSLLSCPAMFGDWSTADESGVKFKLLFYEVNGLQHGEIDFGEDFKSSERLAGVSWNVSGDILAVMWTGRYCRLELWTTSNHEWLLKQTIQLSAGLDLSDSSCLSAGLRWSSMEEPFKLNWFLGDRLSGFAVGWARFVWTTETSANLQLSDYSAEQAYCAVIAGRTLRLTPFRQFIVPPPFGAVRLRFLRPVNCVCFHPSSIDELVASRLLLTAILDDGQMFTFLLRPGKDETVSDISETVENAVTVEYDAIIPSQQTKSRCPLPKLCFHSTYRESYYSFIGLFDSTLLYSVKSEKNGSLVEWFNRSGTDWKPSRNSRSVEETVSAVAMSMTSSKLIGFLSPSGRIVHLDSGDELLRNTTANRVELMAVIEDPPNISNRMIVQFATDRHSLWLNDVQLLDDCTGFLIHQRRYLLAATHSHQLFCINLSDLGEVLSGPKKLKDLADQRPIERGSRLVTTCPTTTRLVLQMPRGNLELIHPRVFVINEIGRLLDEMNYADAFLLTRQHRVNLNLLFDYNRINFVERLPQVLDQLSAVRSMGSQGLNLFLGELAEEDVVRTMYSKVVTSGGDGPDTVEWPEGKVVGLCTMIAGYLNGRLFADPINLDYLTPLLTCHMRMDEIKLEQEKAGHFIDRKDLTGLADCLGIIGRVKALSGRDAAGDGLRYLALFVKDADQLYRTAVGVYDFHLAAFVAECIQKDPKEYVPQLEGFMGIPDEPYRRYSVDYWLQRYENAVRHLAEAVGCCEDAEQRQKLIDQFLNLIESQQLYWVGVVEAARSPQLYSAVCERYSDLLLTNSRFTDSALLLLKSGQPNAAVQRLLTAPHQQLSKSWQTAVISIVAAAGLDGTAAHLSQLAGKLLAAGCHGDAAVVYGFVGLVEKLDLNRTLAKNLQICSKALNNWRLALAYDYIMVGSVSNEFHSELAEMVADVGRFVEKSLAKWKELLGRLVLVRKEKWTALRTAFQDDSDDQLAKSLCDTSSVTTAESDLSTGSSRSSKRSGKSAKNRRKAQRQNWSLRPGGRGEENGLLDALHSLWDEVVSRVNGVDELICCCLITNEDRLAMSLYRSFGGLCHELRTSRVRAWPNTLPQMVGADRWRQLGLPVGLVTDASLGGEPAVSAASAASTEGRLEVDMIEALVRLAPTDRARRQPVDVRLATTVFT